MLVTRRPPRAWGPWAHWIRRPWHGSHVWWGGSQCNEVWAIFEINPNVTPNISGMEPPVVYMLADFYIISN